MPIHEADERKLDVDPYDYIHEFKHSPKPDWMIFRDVARAMHSQIGSGPFAAAFGWNTSAELADEMAADSHRGPDHPKGLGLANLDKFAATLRPPIPQGQRVHALLGASDLGNINAEARHLKTNYVVAETISCTGSQCNVSGADETSAVYVNGVASNGIFLPLAARENGGAIQLVGHLSVRREGESFYFVEAPWEEIEEAFKRVNHIADEDEDDWRDRGGSQAKNRHLVCFVTSVLRISILSTAPGRLHRPNTVFRADTEAIRTLSFQPFTEPSRRIIFHRTKPNMIKASADLRRAEISWLSLPKQRIMP